MEEGATEHHSHKMVRCLLVLFYPWFNFYFLLFNTHHTLLYTKTKENTN